MATKKEVKLTFAKSDVPKLIKKWTQANKSVDEVDVVNVIQYLTPDQRIHFVNELFRVLKDDGKARLVIPHWAASKAYADLDVVWPPIVGGWFYFLDADWRKQNGQEKTKYKCNFTATWGWGLHPSISTRNQEYQQHAVTFWIEAAQDLACTLVKK